MAAGEEALKVRDEIKIKVMEINETTKNLNILVGAKRNSIYITARGVSVIVPWHNQYTNTLKNSSLTVREINGRVLLPEERGKKTLMNDPKPLSDHEFHPDITSDKGWCWVPKSDSKRHYTSSDIADYSLSVFLKLVDKAYRGELPPLDDF